MRLSCRCFSRVLVPVYFPMRAGVSVGLLNKSHINQVMFVSNVNPSRERLFTAASFASMLNG